MSWLSSRNVKAALYDEYGGFADKRIKDLDRNALFIVDDRGPGDYDARRQLFLWFCQIFAEVRSAECIRVKIRGDLPKDHNVMAWLEERSAENCNFGIEFDISPATQPTLDELAERVANIIRKPYPVRSYKYVAPRTASSIHRLSKVLETIWER